MAGNDNERLWCVLRTTSASTIPLLKSLTALGMEVWTPVHVQKRQMPRTKAKVTREVAMMPTYLFARVAHLHDLVQLAVLPVKDHRDFRIFQHMNRYPLVSDAGLAALRTEERKLQVVEKAKPAFGVGAKVRFAEGGFEGLSGVVESVKGKFAQVSLPGYYGNAIKVAAWHLVLDEEESPELQRAA